jgi:NADPH:quinone reductase-like Zn-dependent oxidoreductase
MSCAEAAPGAAMLWGLGRVLANEHQELRLRMVDIQGLDGGSAALRFAAELLDPDDETEVFLTEKGRFAPRLAKHPADDGGRVVRDSGRTVTRLGFSGHGSLEGLRWSEVPIAAPGEGQVAIRVQATGLNFRDLMWVMGLLQDEALENGFAGPGLGMECSGEVVEVGPGVHDFAPGDRVLAFAPASFSDHVVTNARVVARLPQGMDFAAAATLPTTFFTVYYAFKYLARLEPGERVLIHGAAGGVGIAALQVATLMGAEIFATVGSERKRDFLRLIGVSHVFDSRSLSFADGVLEATGGQGVDVVLNTLAGEAVTKGLNLLRPFGRFLELGKRDFYADSLLGVRPMRNNISYFGIDADQLLEERPALCQQLWPSSCRSLSRGCWLRCPIRCSRQNGWWTPFAPCSSPATWARSWAGRRIRPLVPARPRANPEKRCASILKPAIWSRAAHGASAWKPPAAWRYAGRAT